YLVNCREPVWGLFGRKRCEPSKRNISLFNGTCPVDFLNESSTTQTTKTETTFTNTKDPIQPTDSKSFPTTTTTADKFISSSTDVESFFVKILISIMSQNPLVSIMTASSNSGSACLHELYKKYSKQVRIRGVFRSQEKSEIFARKYPNIETVSGCDATKFETLSKAFVNADYALIVTPLDQARGMQNDSDLTIAMINAAVQYNVKYITILKWTILRPGFFMDNTWPSVQKSIKTGVIALPDYEAFYVSTKDIGKSAAACLGSIDIEQHNQKCYEIYGPENLNVEKMAQIVEKVTKKSIRSQLLSKEDIKKFMSKEAFQSFVIDEKVTLPHYDHVKILTNEWTCFEEFLQEKLENID
ncbi:unnamed protein product, partial [Brachionus calyciflorus]